MLDAADGLLEDLDTRVWQLTAFARPLARRYVDSLGLVQGWSMFANPPRGHEYLRFRYYSARGPAREGPLTVVTELVFPVARETENHIVRAFWQGHRDKAVSNAFGVYFRERIRRKEAGLPSLSAHDPALDKALARSFVPVVQFFSSRHARSDENVLRTEVWYGWAESRPRGDVAVAPQSHAAAIERYYRGPSEESASGPIFQPIDSIEREADIQWLLIYIQAP